MLEPEPYQTISQEGNLLEVRMSPDSLSKLHTTAFCFDLDDQFALSQAGSMLVTVGTDGEIQ